MRRALLGALLATGVLVLGHGLAGGQPNPPTESDRDDSRDRDRDGHGNGNGGRDRVREGHRHRHRTGDRERDQGSERKRNGAPSAVRCVRYKQVRQAGATLVLRLDNGCAFPVDCQLGWKVACGDKRKVQGEDSAHLSLRAGATDSTVAEASVCGDDDWHITGVTWTCEKSAGAVDL